MRYSTFNIFRSSSIDQKLGDLDKMLGNWKNKCSEKLAQKHKSFSQGNFKTKIYFMWWMWLQSNNRVTFKKTLEECPCWRYCLIELLFLLVINKSSLCNIFVHPKLMHDQASTFSLLIVIPNGSYLIILYLHATCFTMYSCRMFPSLAKTPRC